MGLRHSYSTWFACLSDDKYAVCQKKNTLEPVERIVPANGQKAYTCCKKADLEELVTEELFCGGVYLHSLLTYRATPCVHRRLRRPMELAMRQTVALPEHLLDPFSESAPNPVLIGVNFFRVALFLLSVRCSKGRQE